MAGDDRGVIEVLTHDHREVENLLNELEKADLDSAGFAALTGQLMRPVNA